MLASWFPIHVVLLSTALTISLPRIIADRKFPWDLYQFEDVFVFIGLVTVLISAMLHMNEKSLNYIAAYFYIFGIGYYALKYLLYRLASVEKIMYVNLVAVIVVALFAVSETALNYFLGFDVQSFIPRMKEASAGYHGVFSRAYGLASEPGTLIFYFNTLGILALWALWNCKSLKRFLKIVLSALLFLAWICTFSAGGFTFMITSIIVVSILKYRDVIIAMRRYSKSTISCNKNSRRRIKIVADPISRQLAPNYRYAWTKMAISAAVVLSIIIVLEYYDTINYALEPIIAKVTLQRSSISAESRLARWNYALVLCHI